jgi:hypothetical protein
MRLLPWPRPFAAARLRGPAGVFTPSSAAIASTKWLVIRKVNCSPCIPGPATPARTGPPWSSKINSRKTVRGVGLEIGLSEMADVMARCSRSFLFLPAPPHCITTANTRRTNHSEVTQGSQSSGTKNRSPICAVGFARHRVPHLFFL